mmetsp:Transcript_99140/g.300931  ORF Transcript_99140/g.300931 Transcript_99140/m.300931 type:complete len:161 (+) Transcript_99140:68-550(+)
MGRASMNFRAGLAMALMARLGRADVDLDTCRSFFGGAYSNATVVDLDAPGGYTASGNHVFIHFTGGLRCKLPNPPMGCHRYITVQYSNSSCLDLGDGRVATVGTAGDFNGAGVYTKCADFVQSSSMRCYTGGTARTPCACPGEGSLRGARGSSGEGLPVR